MTIKELIEKRVKLVEEMKSLLALADKETRSMTTEEETKWNTIDADVKALAKDIERRQRIEEEERSMAAPRNPVKKADIRGNDPGATDPGQETTEERKQKVNKTFEKWVRHGVEGLNEEERGIMSMRRGAYHESMLPPELRAQSTSTTAGGYLIPEGFSNQLEKALKAFGGVRSVATVLTTPTGADIQWPTVDDTSNLGAILSENSPTSEQAVTFSRVTLVDYKYTSKIVLVSLELLEDSFFDVNSLLRDMLAERIGRITNQHFTTGTGTGQPKGIVTESGLGVTGGSGQTTSVTADDLIDLAHAPNSAYRSGPGFVGYMMADSTLKVVKKLKDSQNRYLWLPTLSANEPDTINGYPYVVNDDMPALGTNGSPAVGNKSVLFGNFSKYIVRDIMQITLLRLVERYAEYGQVGFLAFSRHDGRAIQPAAIKHYQNSDA